MLSFGVLSQRELGQLVFYIGREKETCTKKIPNGEIDCSCMSLKLGNNIGDVSKNNTKVGKR